MSLSFVSLRTQQRSAGSGSLPTVSESAYTTTARERLATWTEPTYEDIVELCGEVSMANVRGGQFTLVLATGETPSGRFSAEQEAFVLEALRHHREVRLRVKAIGEFNQADRSLRRLVRVEHTEIATAGPPSYDDSVPPIWQVVSEIGSQAPDGTWDQVPRDLSKRVDEYVYGTPKPLAWMLALAVLFDESSVCSCGGSWACSMSWVKK